MPHSKKPARFAFAYFLVPLFLCCALAAPSGAQTNAPQTSGAPARVAIFPFSMHTPPQLNYLQDGIRDMLGSRLGWQGKVSVMDKNTVEAAVRGVKGDMTPAEATRIGKSLKADYVLYGSVTGLGQSISIDAKMVPIAGNAEPMPVFAQSKTLDDVIPQVNNMAQKINQKIFGRPGESDDDGQSETDAAMLRNPEFLLPDSTIVKDKISYLNPNFIEITPEASLRQSGIWQSQPFQGGIVGMDIGDLDGDGRPEVVTVMKNTLTVYRKDAHGLKALANYSGTSLDRFLSVSIVDLNRNGHGIIFLTNLRTLNLTKAATSESVTGNRGFVEALASYALGYDHGKITTLTEPCAYFLNGVDLPGRGKVLLGQEKGESTESAFKPGVFEMQLRGRSIDMAAPVPLPSRCNVYNFARADINNDKMDEYIIIDSQSHLLILNATGDQLWRGDRIFGATTNGFEGKVNDRRYNDVDFFYVPSPILITDLNHDGILEIVVNRSTDSASKFMPEGLKYFEKSEIVSLSWDQMGIVENWKTRELNGMVTSLHIADTNNDNTPELMATLVLAKDVLKIWEAKSTIFSYELKVAPPAPKATATATTKQ